MGDKRIEESSPAIERNFQMTFGRACGFPPPHSLFRLPGLTLKRNQANYSEVTVLGFY